MRLALEHPVTLVCQTLSYPRSLYYYEAKGRDEEALRNAIMEVAGAWPTYGYRRVTAQLRREDWRINAKRVRRVMAEMGLEGKTYRPRLVGGPPTATTLSRAFLTWLRSWRW